MQTFRRKGPTHISFLDLRNRSKIDWLWSEFGSSKRYLEWTPKRTQYRAHFWVHLFGLSFPNRGPHIAYVFYSASSRVPPVPWRRFWKNGPKNGLRRDPNKYYFGVHFRGTKMGHSSDLQNGIISSGWGVPKVKQSRTRMQGRDPGWAMKVRKKGPRNGPQFKGTKHITNICFCLYKKGSQSQNISPQHVPLFGPPNRSIWGPQSVAQNIVLGLPNGLEMDEGKNWKTTKNCKNKRHI